jgi:lysophospholipase L1-like esterase
MRKALAYSLMALLLPLQICAQSLRKEIPHLEFACLQDNCIEFRGDSVSFERFFDKMDSVLFFGEGNLRIVHIGGSHVQAGTLTRRLRNDLMSLRPALDGGRGLVFPFSAAHTNNPSSFTVSYQGLWSVSKNTQREPDSRLGLTGITLTTSDDKASVTVTMVARNPKPTDPSFKFNQVRVLGYSRAGGREPVVVAGLGDTLTAQCGADSCWTFVLPAFSDSVRVATRGAGEFTLKGICLENPYPGITVTEIGVNGASLGSYAKCLDFERDLALLKPDMVILAVGINDATAANFSEDDFVLAYKALVARIRSVAPDGALLFITNNDSCRKVRKKGYVTNANGQVAERAFLRLGKDCNAGVWDLFKVMGGLGSMRDWESAGLAKRDKVHFTESGYELVGDLLFNALMDSYVQHLKSSK